ncbi:ABC transporter substrate-binding protein [Kocuria rhizophila]|uniref:Putative ABC transporter substrate-binding protein n=1 Tax=Kocuria rhizophila (strain ATCC 9341 / DSM 348 / NBRC 103217 / DC2201) TaxID=378753 RepID=B2GFJ1_KOCRD|nr:ABC transporter substrate-binding protein [Kocuria rhizophila]ASE10723.1 ABC transporter substrate-binding protein [Kocuria rhizophila]MDV5998923.1 ABC transporter substrate-binding protein [Kocuria rhizophila]BAG29364.1 putative ABC transporter substrate-binding protein [Kocuria rhizophila DC2201]VEH75357.1 Hemin-binding lipoprotein [Kocuria rhizophila]
MSAENAFGRRTFLAAAGLGLALAGCGERGARSGGSPSVPNGTFVLAHAAAPTGLDPSRRNSQETSRISTQILEGLVSADRSTGEPAPGLAESWEIADDKRSVTFTLRDDVRFHDGTELDAAAVKANFDKWRAQAESGEPWAHRSAFATTFRHGYTDPMVSTSYAGVEVRDERTVVLTLTRPYSPLLSALTQPAFGIASPGSIEAGTEDEHPVGTGPFRFDSASGTTVKLVSNERYWGDLGQVGSLEMRVIPDAEVRCAALLGGEVDAYDLVGLDDFAPLAREGVQVLYRDPYAVSYLGLNQRVPALRDVSVRRAVAAAIDRRALATSLFPNGTNVADQFVPARFNVNGEHLQLPGYDPQHAKDLLRGSAYKGERLRFCYPRNTSRMYLQEPERVYAQISAQLTRAGFRITPVPVDWEDGYVETATDPGADHALSLLGWSGSFRDPDSFLGPLLGSSQARLGCDDAGLSTAVNRAAAMAQGDPRTASYKALNDRVSEVVPAVPLSHPVSAVAVSSRVVNFPLTSTGFERFNEIQLS